MRLLAYMIEDAYNLARLIGRDAVVLSVIFLAVAIAYSATVTALAIVLRLGELLIRTVGG